MDPPAFQQKDRHPPVRPTVDPLPNLRYTGPVVLNLSYVDPKPALHSAISQFQEVP